MKVCKIVCYNPSGTWGYHDFFKYFFLNLGKKCDFFYVIKFYEQIDKSFLEEIYRYGVQVIPIAQRNPYNNCIEDIPPHEEAIKIFKEIKPDIIFGDIQYGNHDKIRESVECPCLTIEAGFQNRSPIFNVFLDVLDGYKDSFLHSYIKKIRRNILPNFPQTDVEKFCKEYKGRVRGFLLSQHSDIFHKVIGDKNFDKYVLIPLTRNVEPFFEAIKEYKFQSQMEYLEYILTNIDPRTGVIITQYLDVELDRKSLTESAVVYLKKKYHNAIFEENLKIFAISQYIIPHVDAVIACFSSVAIQSTLQWGKILCALGNSHINIYANCNTVSELNNILYHGKNLHFKGNITSIEERDRMFYYLMTHYYLPRSVGSDVYLKFFQNCIKKYHNGIDENFYERIDSDQNILNSLLSNCKPEKEAPAEHQWYTPETIKSLEKELIDIKNSKAWALVMFLRRIKIKFKKIFAI